MRVPVPPCYILCWVMGKLPPFSVGLPNAISSCELAFLREGFVTDESREKHRHVKGATQIQGAGVVQITIFRLVWKEIRCVWLGERDTREIIRSEAHVDIMEVEGSDSEAVHSESSVVLSWRNHKDTSEHPQKRLPPADLFRVYTEPSPYWVRAWIWEVRKTFLMTCQYVSLNWWDSCSADMISKACRHSLCCQVSFQ